MANNPLSYTGNIQSAPGRPGLIEVASLSEAQAAVNDEKAMTPYLVGQVAAGTVPDATETVKGKIELATQAETDAGTDDTKAVTPLKLANYPNLVAQDASETVKGILELATQAEANAGTDDTRAITPLKLANVPGLITPAASETVSGSVELATQAEANAGTDDLRAITPLKLANIPGLITPAASETVSGSVELATQAEANAGTDDLRAITPLKLANVPGIITPDSTESVKGKIQLATQVEANAGTDDTKAITPLKLANFPFPSPNLSSPPAIGDVTPNTGAFSTLSSNGNTNLGTNASSAINIGNTNGTTFCGLSAGTLGISTSTTGNLLLYADGLINVAPSGAGDVNIAHFGFDGAINIGIAGNKAIQIGNGLGTTAVTIDVGSGGASLGSNATDHSTVVGSTIGASPLTLNAGTSGITFVGGSATESKVGVAEIATQAEANAGVDDSRFITPLKLANYPFPTPATQPLSVTFSQAPLLQSNAPTGGAPTGVAGDINLVQFQNGLLMEQFIIGTQTNMCPRMNTFGLDVALDQTNGDGCEFNFGVSPQAGHQYVIGTSAAFFVEATFKIEDVSGVNPVGVGFRSLQANSTSYFSGYTDQYLIGANLSLVGKFISNRRLNSASTTQVLTKDWLDGETHKIRIMVDGAGAVTCEIDDVDAGVAAFSFDTGDTVIPWVRIGHGADIGGQINWLTFSVGLQ